ncbi:hypothetical protein TNCV_4908681 [Trichonephila clavipes]|uniref:Transposase n=1 Tax=Trichonephila clavipes TaxID=2585209 RepID=A0A8X6RPK2_TRICX|nr:hypothetical protein TNCV_4908681 [Trichonephila clavipes]
MEMALKKRYLNISRQLIISLRVDVKSRRDEEERPEGGGRVRILPNHTEGEKDYNDDHRDEITDFVQSIPGFQECDEDLETWMVIDAEERLSGFQMLNDDEIVTSVQAESDPIDDETDEEEDNNESSKGPSNTGTFSALETAMERCQVIYSQFGLAFHQNDHQARRRFVEWAQTEIAVVPDFHKRILFSDEAHFWLNGYVNKKNCHIWNEANPQVYVETPLHPEKLTVWCALWAGGILLQKR